MNYDIKILGEDIDNGLIEFDRLNLLTKSTKDIATKALMLRLKGFSEISPDKYIKKALDLRLQSINGSPENGTSMTIDCAHFSDTIKGVQLEMFKPREDVLKMTPMSLVIDSFQIALNENIEEADIDKPLLKSLMNFRKNFISDNEIFYLANRGTIPAVRITKDDFHKISVLEDSIPESKKVVINGQLDEMKVSKNKLGLQTENGFVNVFANDKNIIQGILEFMGKEVTISGIAHYKPNGRLSFIEIQDFGKPQTTDKFFSRQPNAMTVKQQLLFQTKQVKKPNVLIDIIGQWPGDESDNEFAEILKGVK
ncbi:MAG: hypothetical protein IPO14_10410 [Saprospiraceae bacterium]|jgi:hypothetical protein|nr:hypothetical protein [Saprospiraceae bacterium]